MDTNKTVLYYIRAGLALVALLGFVYLYGRAIIDSLAGAAPVYNDAYLYVATALAGLVGGVAATSLGQTVAYTRFSLRRRLNTLGRVLAPFQPENIQNVLAIAYTVIYILYGVTALIVWIGAREPSSVVALLRDLALVFIGLLLATAQSFLGAPNDAGTPTHPPEVPPGARKSKTRAAAKPSDSRARRHK